MEEERAKYRGYGTKHLLKFSNYRNFRLNPGDSIAIRVPGPGVPTKEGDRNGYTCTGIWYAFLREEIINKGLALRSCSGEVGAKGRITMKLVNEAHFVVNLNRGALLGTVLTANTLTALGMLEKASQMASLYTAEAQQMAGQQYQQYIPTPIQELNLRPQTGFIPIQEEYLGNKWREPPVNNTENYPPLPQPVPAYTGSIIPGLPPQANRKKKKSQKKQKGGYKAPATTPAQANVSPNTTTMYATPTMQETVIAQELQQQHQTKAQANEILRQQAEDNAAAATYGEMDADDLQDTEDTNMEEEGEALDEE
jgi:hypothetical protein